MRIRWNHAVFALALAGGAALALLAARAQQPRNTEPREAPAGTRRDIREDTRQLRRDRRDIRQDARHLRAARRRYGKGSPQALAVHRDICHDRRSAHRTRRDRNRDVRIHRRRVARRL
ncbi:MAG TPA: hypothetical protein VNJ52_10560 [Patescibacteria group bacterium]|nr:hypothetical protein [Patescibacteria group bacterium]